MAREERVIEMTTGSLWKNILLFSLPLMLTQVLEVLFNLSDVAIAGKVADYRALGAVGSTTLLVSLFTGLLIGIGSGVNVAVARGLGLRDGGVLLLPRQLPQARAAGGVSKTAYFPGNGATAVAPFFFTQNVRDFACVGGRSMIQ